VLGDVGERFLNRTQPSLEAQIANLADEIDYNNHDIDDGLRSGLITIAQLQELELFSSHYDMVKRRYPRVEGRRLVYEIIRAMINTLVIDLTETTRSRIAQHRPNHVDELRQLPMMAAFSPEMRAQADALKRFLLANLYHHWRVLRMTRKARRIVRELFLAFIEEPRLLAPGYRREDEMEQARAIADYIAGMTDRYAIREHRQLYQMD